MTIDINGMAHVILTVSRFDLARAFYSKGQLCAVFRSFARLRRSRCDSTDRWHGPGISVRRFGVAPGAGTSEIFFGVTTFMTLFLF